MSRLRKILVIMITIAVIFSIIACNKEPVSKKTQNLNIEENKEFERGTKTVIDIMGREVVVPEQVKSIVVSPIPYTSMIYAIDGTGEKLIAIHPSAKKAYIKSLLNILAPEIEEVPDEYIGQDFTINIEEIVKLKPDVVVLWSNQEDDIKKLEQINIPVITLTNGANSNIEEMRKNMRIIGDLLGKEEVAEKLIEFNEETEDYFKKKLNSVSDESKPKVLYLRDKELKASAGESFNRQIIEMTGATNVAKDVKGSWTAVSMEQIITWDPEIIYLSHFDDFTPEDLYTNNIPGQDWSNVTAVKNKRVYKTPIGIYRWDAPNAETPLFMKWMGQIHQPDIYKDYVLIDDIKEFYKNFFGHNLSEEEINIIFNK